MDPSTPPPLLVSWLNAVTKYNSIDASTKDSTDPTLIADINEALQTLKTLHSQIDAAGIISKYEDAEDLVTSNIKYYLCEFYLGMLELKLNDDRHARALAGKHHLTAFLEHCDRAGLVLKDDKKALQNDFADAASRRTDLMAREKRDNVAKKRLDELVKLKKEKVAAKGAEAVEDAEGDDEYERETVMLTVHMAVRRALRELDMTNRELEMLAIMRNRPSQPPQQPPPAAAGKAKPKAQAKAPASAAAIPLMPSNIAPQQGKSRQQIIAEVFRPGWTQPIYSVEDAVEIDIANGKIVQETDKSSSSSKKKTKDEEEDEDDDETIQKARAWDDWKDTHPAGSGNRLRQG